MAWFTHVSAYGPYVDNIPRYYVGNRAVVAAGKALECAESLAMMVEEQWKAALFNKFFRDIPVFGPEHIVRHCRKAVWIASIPEEKLQEMGQFFNETRLKSA